MGLSPDPEVCRFLARCGVSPSRLVQIDLLAGVLDRLREANRRSNLTRLTGAADFWLKHVADSLSIGVVVPELLCAKLRVADVGCGAGFPGIPLAWANPQLAVTGIDARAKKAHFVREQFEILGLDTCTAVARQVSEAARMAEHAGSYDVAVLRAVRATDRMVRAASRLLKVQESSLLAFYMTPQSISEAMSVVQREARKSRLAVAVSDELELPCGAGTRQFLLLRPGATA